MDPREMLYINELHGRLPFRLTVPRARGHFLGCKILHPSSVGFRGVKIDLKQPLKDYILGKKNIVQDEFIISREKNSKTNCEFVYVQHPEMDNPMYTFWHSLRGGGKNKKPKHTGGKKPYAMLMIENLIGLMEDGMPAEYAGYLLYLVPYIEWGTGKLLYGRKKRPMRSGDITAVFKKKRRSVFLVLAKLKEYNLLYYVPGEGYFVSREIIKRGARKSEAEI
ncbi:MAG: hypothetical protein WC958_06150 [Dehalococcoidales bacterium]